MTVWVESVLRVLAESSMRSAIIAVFTGLTLVVSRTRTRQILHAAWTTVMCAMLFMPILAHWSPAIPIRVPMYLAALPEPPSDQSSMPLAGTAISTPASNLPATPSAVPQVPIAAPPQRSIVNTPLYAVWTAYLCGLFVLLLRFALGWWGSHRIARRSGRICVSERVAAPMTVGVLSPKIILPVAFSSWPVASRRAVLTHEIAHIRRRDPLVRFSFPTQLLCLLVSSPGLVAGSSTERRG